MTVHLIWAQSRNGVIGAGNAIPWRVPGEQLIFKERTMGAPVVMGRSTWDSLPARVRPLPGRRNVVLTRDPGWAADGATVAHSPEEVDFPDYWVIGGSQIYQAFLPKAGHIVRTTVELEVEGDAYAPILGPEWAVSATSGWLTATDGQRYVVEDLVRPIPQGWAG